MAEGAMSEHQVRTSQVHLETSCIANSFDYKWTINDPLPLLTNHAKCEPLVTPSFKTHITITRDGVIYTPYWRLSFVTREDGKTYCSTCRDYCNTRCSDGPTVGFGIEISDGIDCLEEIDTTGLWMNATFDIEVAESTIETNTIPTDMADMEGKAVEIMYQTPLYNLNFASIEYLSNYVKDNKLTLSVHVSTYDFGSLNATYSTPSPCSGELQTSNSCSDLSNLMNQSRKNGEFTDVVITANGQEFSAHKSVLAAQSEFFKTKFQRWERDDKVDMSEVSPEAMEAILSFLYIRKTDIHTNEFDLLFEMLKISEKYQIKSLFDYIKKSISGKLNEENVIKTLLTAHCRDMAEVKKACLVNIVKNFSKVAKTEEWKRLEESTEHLAVYKEVIREVTELLKCKDN